MDAYNYPAFSFGLDGPGIETWLRDGPKPGEPAPAFELPALDGDMVRLSDLLGRPVVIEFGSYTCSTDYIARAIKYFQAHHISWLAWTWGPYSCSSPSLLAAWPSTPSVPYGSYIKQQMLQVSASGA